MRDFDCSRCGSRRFILVDLENGTIEARCIICDLKVRLKLIEPKKE